LVRPKIIQQTLNINNDTKLNINEEIIMNLDYINEIKDFCYWAQKELNKSVNFEISFWNYCFDDSETITYRLFINKTIHRETDSLDELVQDLVKFKEFCLMKKELSL
jgi:hypothetical protein